jgi:hypothetical protein
MQKANLEILTLYPVAEILTCAKPVLLTVIAAQAWDEFP